MTDNAPESSAGTVGALQPEVLDAAVPAAEGASDDAAGEEERTGSIEQPAKLLRIGSILRRTKAQPPRPPLGTVRFGPFTFSLERGELRADDEIVRLTERERDMLRVLCANAGESVTRQALTGSGAAANERTIDVQINRLRRKIEVDPANPLYLQTARGAGYRLVVDG